MAPDKDDVPEHWRKIDALLDEINQLTGRGHRPIGVKPPATEEADDPLPLPPPPLPVPADTTASRTLANSLLAASIFSRLPASGDKMAPELMRVLSAVEKHSKK